MKTKAHLTKPVIPDGEYAGTWGGYSARFSHAELEEITLETEEGIRRHTGPAIITVKDGEFTVEAK